MSIHKGLILKELIRNSNKTQKDVAALIGVDAPYLSILLKNPDIKEDIIDRVCEALGVDKSKYFSEGVAEDGAAYGRSQPLYHNRILPDADSYLQEKGAWLEEKSELLNKLQAANAEIFSFVKRT